MRAVIFAGGKGSRLAEETTIKPKPMVEIGGRPILWHIMKHYAHYGINEFVICLGYKGHMIKEWFVNYSIYNSDISVNLKNNELHFHNTPQEDWHVTLIDTGEESGTATRLRRIKAYVHDDENFMLTYGDGVGDVDLKQLYTFHKAHGKTATVTAVQPEGRFGALAIDDDGTVNEFAEKLDGKKSWVNGGFFLLNRDVFNYIPNRDVMWEQEPLYHLSGKRELIAYRHYGFWKPMDTMRDKERLEELWRGGSPPWKVWED